MAIVVARRVIGEARIVPLAATSAAIRRRSGTGRVKFADADPGARDFDRMVQRGGRRRRALARARRARGPGALGARAGAGRRGAGRGRMDAAQPRRHRVRGGSGIVHRHSRRVRAGAGVGAGRRPAGGPGADTGRAGTAGVARRGRSASWPVSTRGCARCMSPPIDAAARRGARSPRRACWRRQRSPPRGRDWFGAGNGFARIPGWRAARTGARRRAARPTARAVGELALPRLAAGEGVAAADALPLYVRHRVALTTAERAAGARL